MTDHDLRTASNGTVSCKRCGLVLSPGEVRGVYAPPACFEVARAQTTSEEAA